MADGLLIGSYLVCTEESQHSVPDSGARVWLSSAFLYRGENALRAAMVLAPVRGGDALEARRHALNGARRYIGFLERAARRMTQSGGPERTALPVNVEQFMDRATATALIDRLCREVPAGGSPEAGDFDYGWFRKRVGTVVEHCRAADGIYIWRYAILRLDEAGLMPDGMHRSTAPEPDG